MCETQQQTARSRSFTSSRDFRTPDNRSAMSKADPDKWVPPEQIASTMRFLCSQAAASINGVCMPIYGAV